MSVPTRHWPSGIPSSIQGHPAGNLSMEELKEEVKGWLLFVQENWIPRFRALPDQDRSEVNDEYELRQRRELVEQWASATQDLRNSYHTRAETPADNEEPRYPPPALERIQETIQQYDRGALICLAPINPTNELNRARLVKLAILLYRHDAEAGHCLENAYIPVVLDLNPMYGSRSSFEDFPRWSYLDRADFSSIYLTRSGTVVYNGFLGPYFLIDQEGLGTGRLSLVEFNQNGTVKHAIPIRPFNMRWPYMDLTVNGKEIEEIVCSDGGKKHQNTPINMDLPILDILTSAKEANQLDADTALCNREQWTEDVELYAPGYLALEAQGREADYNLSNLVDPESLRGVKKRIWDKLKGNQVSGFTYLPSVPEAKRREILGSRAPPMDFQAMLKRLSQGHQDGRGG